MGEINTLGRSFDAEKQHNLKSLDDLAPGEVLAFSRSPYKATLMCVSSSNARPKLKTITLPDSLKNDPICLSLIAFLNSTVLNSYSPYTIGQYLSFFKGFLKFADIYYGKKGELPIKVMIEFLRHLRDDRACSQASLGTYFSKFRTALNWSINNLETLTFNDGEQVRRLYAIRAELPIIHAAASRPRASLSQLFERTQDDDFVLLQSLVRYCCHFLLMMARHREYLLSCKNVRLTLEKLMHKSGKSDLSELIWDTKNVARLELYKPIYKAICTSDDITLKERLLLSHKSLRQEIVQNKEPMTLERANKILAEGYTSNKRLRYVKYQKCRYFTYEGLDYLSLLIHTQEEEACMAWLLASERIQQGGQIRLQIEDAQIFGNGLSFKFLKNRSSQPNRETRIHGRRSLQYRIYTNYLTLRSHFAEDFPHLEEAKNMISNKALNGYMCLGSSRFRALMASSYQASAIGRELLDKDLMCLPFLKLLNNLNRHNENARLEKNAYVRAVERHQRTGEKTHPGPQSQYLKVRHKSITTTHVAQSRAIIEQDSVELNSPYDRYAKEVVDADATAHSPDVKKEVYLYRSETKYRVKKREAFSSAVGQLMEEDARKVIEQLNSTHTVTIAELETMLGWSKTISDKESLKDFNELLLVATKDGYSVTPFGELLRGDKRIVIVTPVSAALMLSYQRHCHKELDQVATNNEERVIPILLQIAYITELLSKFDESTIQKGEELLQTHDFPQPVIT